MLHRVYTGLKLVVKVKRSIRIAIIIFSVVFLQAQNFKHTSQKVARHYWWKNVKLMVVMIVIVAIIILIIVLLATGVIPTSSQTPPPTTPKP